MEIIFVDNSTQVLEYNIFEYEFGCFTSGSGKYYFKNKEIKAVIIDNIFIAVGELSAYLDKTYYIVIKTINFNDDNTIKEVWYRNLRKDKINE